MTALSPDVMRASEEVKAVYERKMTDIANAVAAGMNGRSDEERLRVAWGFLQTLIGGLLLSRSVSSDKEADRIAAAAKQAAMAIAGD